MRKGLTLTLMTVAIAMLSVKALALAPVIQDIPSPIVGNGDFVTGVGKFVYPDAFDLNTLATDDTTTISKLMWTYEIASSHYKINGIAPISSASTDPTSPTTNQIINWKVLGGENNPDGKANTITIRNSALSPLGGTEVTPTLTGVLAAEKQLVTFYVSDGNAYSSSTVFFYSDNGGVDRVSGTNTWTKMVQNDFTASWAWKEGPYGVTLGTWTDGKGMCLEVPLTGENFGSVGSNYGYFTLAKNQVYRVRARMNSTQATTGKTPFWDLVIENYDGVSGLNIYGLDAYFLDNEGGANSVLTTTPGTWYTMYWTPNCVNLDQWNNTTSGFFTSAYAANKDGRIRFRVLDVDSNGGTNAKTKFGKICLQELVVESAPITSMKEGTVLYTNTNLTQASTAANSGTVKATFLVGTTLAFASGALTCTPTGAGQSDEIVTIVPATNSNPEPVAAPWDDLTNKYPIAWQTGKILKFEAGLSAPTATDASKPWDVIWMSMEPPTNETNTENVLTSNAGLSSPKVGTEQKYVFLYYTMNKTASLVPQFANLRWRLRFGNSSGLRFPTATDLTNTGAVKVTSIKVSEVTFQ